MKIAIVKLSAMGDIVHAMVALQFIKSHYPESKIDWIVEESFASVLQHNPHIDNILTVNLKALKIEKRKLFLEIKKVKSYAKNNYDIVIDVQGLIKSAIVARILGKTAGFDSKSIREKQASWFYNIRFSIPYDMNVIERNFLLIMQSINISYDISVLKKKEPFLFFDDSNKEKILPYLKAEEKNIVYILGSSWESKMYPKEKFITLIEALDGNHILVWGSAEEKERAEYIAQHCSALVLPKLTLNELKALVASADLVIGGDSGPTHMAWALNKPSITLFGPTPSKRNTMETEINKVLDCGKEIDPLNLNKNDPCIQDIPVEKIVALVEELCL